MQMSKFTLKDLAPSAQDMKVVHPVHGELDVTIKIQGQYAPTVRQKSIETLAWIQSAQKETKPDQMADLFSKAERSAAETAAAAIVGWSDDEFFGGAYSKEFALQLMNTPEMEFLRTQVNKFVSDQANFFRPVGE